MYKGVGVRFADFISSMGGGGGGGGGGVQANPTLESATELVGYIS